MSLLLALLMPLQDPGQPVLDDPFAADPFRDDVAYRSYLSRVLPLLEEETTREAGDLEVRDLLSKYPGSPLLHYERGCYFGRARKWDLAVREWKEALFADDGRTVVTVRTLEGLAQAETALGHGDSALRFLERMTLALPLSYRAWNRLAEVHASAGRAVKARQAWEKSYALNVQQPGIMKQLGLAPPPKRKREDLPALLKRLQPSIVQLKTPESRFTGFAALSRGWIMTCAHGLGPKTAEVDVICSGRKDPLKGRVCFRDPRRDLAVIHCPELPADLPLLSLLPVGDLRTGDKIYTVGHPGLGAQVLDLTPSEGILAHAQRELEGLTYIQCSMNVNPGNSGGPLLTASGEVIGVIVRKSALEGVCFAVPLIELAESLSSPATLHPPLPPAAPGPGK